MERTYIAIDIKAVFRYARNIMDCISYIRKLKALGGGLYFEENDIGTVQENLKWDKRGIRSMLTNEKYVGDIMFQKRFRTDCISKKTKINRGELDSYLVTDNHPAIIYRETF